MNALFALREVSSGNIRKDMTFPNKPEAKKMRDKLWEDHGKPVRIDEDGTPIPLYPYVVTYGPGHDKSTAR